MKVHSFQKPFAIGCVQLIANASVTEICAQKDKRVKHMRFLCGYKVLEAEKISRLGLCRLFKLEVNFEKPTGNVFPRSIALPQKSVRQNHFLRNSEKKTTAESSRSTLS